MKLIIAEKPDQGAKLAAPFQHTKQKDHIRIESCPLFPEGAVVVWAVGHLCELVPPETYSSEWKKWHLDTLPMIPKSFQFRISKGKNQAYQTIKHFIHDQSVTEIVHAGDAEREGEAIIRLILDQAGNRKPLSRLWISSLTKNAVIKGFEQLKDGDKTKDLYEEALSRTFADWLVGMNASRAYTLQLKAHGINDVYSIGRVQTPTLALIVKREAEILEFVSKPFWEVHAEFQHANGRYWAVWQKENDPRILNGVMAERIQSFCEGKPARIETVTEESKKVHAPAFYNLSALQAMMNKRRKFSPKHTLDIAQKLYVKGYLSYPRTDSRYITTQEEELLPGILGTLSQQDPFKQILPAPFQTIQNRARFVDSTKVKDHYAIMPTEQIPDMKKLSEDERLIYQTVAESIIAAFYPPLEMSYTEINTIVDERAHFTSKGKSVISKGWRKVIPFPEKDKEQALLPVCSKGDPVNGKEFFVEESKTKPPKRYTEGELITLMKTAGKHIDDKELIHVLNQTQGLGTEATRANIISVLQNRQYITIIKNTVQPTAKGMLLIKALGSSILVSPEMTAKWEKQLDLIGSGQYDAAVFMTAIYKMITDIVSESHHHAETWSFTEQEQAALPVRQSKWDKKKRRKAPVGKCPICDEQVIDKGTFYGCSTYQTSGCSFTLSKTILTKKLSLSTVQKMLKDGESPLIEGFKSKGKTFSASLRWNQTENRFAFTFSQATNMTR
ncbi:type IA DNA topoisomerase [Salisediminibacterium beveridgei]|uniref:DNA topoisomerase n=1 Tax=Salisediminibacterium beveridgei TaxID=632773 RepID=A0A1D7QVG8_9BACI|nr:type IA DNA topoisomerase [Salisediminibacterium beveridgei]AOM83014.1 DNA topoisomerase III [Salisediminibacterium beveridgei]